jgi:hypothetical protein
MRPVAGRLGPRRRLAQRPDVALAFELLAQFGRPLHERVEALTRHA